MKILSLRLATVIGSKIVYLSYGTISIFIFIVQYLDIIISFIETRDLTQHNLKANVTILLDTLTFSFIFYQQISFGQWISNCIIKQKGFTSFLPDWLTQLLVHSDLMCSLFIISFIWACYRTTDTHWWARYLKALRQTYTSYIKSSHRSNMAFCLLLNISKLIVALKNNSY